MSNEKTAVKAAKPSKIFTQTEGFHSFLLLLPYGLMFFSFILLPILIAVGLSFTYFDVINTPSFAGMTNYITLITGDEVFMKYVLPNTVLYAIVVGVGGYALSFIMAWILAQVTPRARTLYALAMYTPSMVGQIMIQVIWKTIFSGDQSGLANACMLKLILIDQQIRLLISWVYFMGIMIFVSLWSSMGIGFLSMLSGIMNIDQELYEAAYVDGIKNRAQEIIYITIPSMKPQMLFGAVMSIVNAFNMGWIGVALAGANPTPEYSGQLIANHIDDYAFVRYEMGYAAAVSVALLCLVWVCSQIANKLFTEKDEY